LTPNIVLKLTKLHVKDRIAIFDLNLDILREPYSIKRSNYETLVTSKLIPDNAQSTDCALH